MNIFDIIGPVMVGPSSSHTAGAVRIGYLARKLMGEPVRDVSIGLCGSFWATGRGHGTDRALIAGLLGMQVDDMRIPNSFAHAEEAGMTFRFYEAHLQDAHPNTAILNMTGISGESMEIEAASVGGGRVKICQIDGLEANFYGDYPTLVVQNRDQPGHVSDVASMLAHKSVNIATMQLFRDSRGGRAVTVIECDQEIPEDGRRWLAHCEGILRVVYFSLEEEHAQSPEPEQRI